MAVIEYLEGQHPAGYVGLRVVTTLGSNDEYRQAYFSYSDYLPSKARQLADALHEIWREQARAQRQDDWLGRPVSRAGIGWLASGFRADIVRQRKVRGGELRMYYAPVFMVDRWPPQGPGGHRSFRVNVQTGKSLDEVFHAAVSHYVAIRQLGGEEHAELLSRQPPAQLFVQIAIKLGLKDCAIDINAIRRRVGVPEL